MITSRRSFITGLVSLVAAPAIVRAESLCDADGNCMFNNDATFMKQTLDLSGLAVLRYNRCNFYDCTIIADCQTRMVSFEDCRMENVFLSGEWTADDDGPISFRNVLAPPFVIDFQRYRMAGCEAIS